MVGQTGVFCSSCSLPVRGHDSTITCVFETCAGNGSGRFLLNHATQESSNERGVLVKVSRRNGRTLQAFALRLTPALRCGITSHRQTQTQAQGTSISFQSRGGCTSARTVCPGSLVRASEPGASTHPDVSSFRSTGNTATSADQGPSSLSRNTPRAGIFAYEFLHKSRYSQVLYRLVYLPPRFL